MRAKRIRDSHESCVQSLLAEMKSRGIEAIDYEAAIGDASRKRADIRLVNSRSVIEVKTLFPNEVRKVEEERIAQELRRSRTAGYWVTPALTQMRRHMREAQQKFREDPDCPSALVVYDFHISLRQLPEVLVLGFDRLALDSKSQVSYRGKSGGVFDSVWEDIGAVIFPKYQGFEIWHNPRAKIARRMPCELFSHEADSHKLLDTIK